MTAQPTPEELARRAREVFTQNLDTLVAGFLIRHPDIDPSLVRINMQAQRGGMTAFVTPVQIPIPERKTPPYTSEMNSIQSAANAFADGWNACREELIRSLKAMQEPAMEGDHE